MWGERAGAVVDRPPSSLSRIDGVRNRRRGYCPCRSSRIVGFSGGDRWRQDPVSRDVGRLQRSVCVGVVVVVMWFQPLDAFELSGDFDDCLDTVRALVVDAAPTDGFREFAQHRPRCPWQVAQVAVLSVAVSVRHRQ